MFFGALGEGHILDVSDAWGGAELLIITQVA